jgi:hypothetical protein
MRGVWAVATWLPCQACRHGMCAGLRCSVTAPAHVCMHLLLCRGPGDVLECVETWIRSDVVLCHWTCFEPRCVLRTHGHDFCANKAWLEVGLGVHCTLTPCPSRCVHAMHCMQCARESHRCSLWSSLGVLLRVSLPSHGPCASLFSGARPPLSPTELCSCVR